MKEHQHCLVNSCSDRQIGYCQGNQCDDCISCFAWQRHGQALCKGPIAWSLDPMHAAKHAKQQGKIRLLQAMPICSIYMYICALMWLIHTGVHRSTPSYTHLQCLLLHARFHVADTHRYTHRYTSAILSLWVAMVDVFTAHSFVQNAHACKRTYPNSHRVYVM